MPNKTTIIFGSLIIIFIVLLFYRSTLQPAQQNSTNTTEATVTINGHRFSAELAKTSEEQQKGLSDRDSLPQDHAMLFLFDKPSQVAFWMKDMRFPIDIIFINQDEVVSIAKNAPQPASPNTQLPLYTPEKPSNKVLEINAGLSDKYNIKKGDKLEIKL